MKKDNERDTELKEYYSEFYKDRWEFTGNVQKNQFEEHLNERKFGVFGNAFLTFLVAAVMIGIVVGLIFIFGK